MAFITVLPWATALATGVARLLQFPIESVPQTFLAFPDQTDVGVSGSLQTGLGFFGHPIAAPAALSRSAGLG